MMQMTSANPRLRSAHAILETSWAVCGIGLGKSLVWLAVWSLPLRRALKVPSIHAARLGMPCENKQSG
eukprot:3078534-Amphidinium_carterae.1